MEPRGQHASPARPIQFPFQELNAYTKGFKKQSMLGGGTFGSVYIATIPPNKEFSSQVVAVKVANRATELQIQFEMELKILGSINHPNIIKLVGYSNDNKDCQCLVYEYMQNKSLESHIQGLNWRKCVGIIKDVASALCFLHQQNPQIIFRDLKPGNILLDGQFKAKLSDFGLAKRGNEGQTVGGSRAYADPAQYDVSETLTTKCDVFTFGMLMLELITKDSKKVEKMELLDWILKVIAKDKSHKTIRKVVHADLKKKHDGYTDARAENAISLALDCVGENSKRPTMEEICKKLDLLL